MIIDCISDLHGHYPELEGGDLLIVVGDLTARDLETEHALFDYWINEQSYKEKIVIAGNHDNVLSENRLKFHFCKYLCDSATEFEGLKIWGSPWTRNFYGQNPRCKAFGLDTEFQMKEKFDLIPADTDILITHTPPKDILDKTWKNRCGSTSLRNIVLDTERMPKIKLHVFGHIHECGGNIFETTLCKFVNASYVNENYEPVNKPVRIIL